MPFSRVPSATAAPVVAPSRGRALPAAVAVLLSLAAVTALKWIFFDYVGAPTPFLLYFAPVVAGAWFGGWAGGLLVTLASSVLGASFFFPPHPGGPTLSLSLVVALLVFVFEGVVLTGITDRLRREQRRGRQATLEARGALAQLEAVLRGVSDGITVQTARGELRYANDAAARLTGLSSAREMLSTPVAELLARFELLAPEGGPFDLEQLPGRLVLQGRPAPERLVRFRLRDSGAEHYALVRANAVELPDGAGSELVAVNVFHDVTDKRRHDEALRVSQEWLSTTLKSIGDAVITTDATGQVTFMNPVAEQLTGWSAAEAQGRALADVFSIINEDTRAPTESPVARVVREGKVVGLANHTILIGRDGREHAIDDSAAPIRAADGQLIGTVLVFRDVSDRRTEEQRRDFLARAMAQLAGSIDYEKTLATVAALAVPVMADWCAIDMLDGDVLRRLAVHHADPAKVRLLFDLEGRYPSDPAAGRGAYQVVRTGQPVVLAEITDQMLEASARSAEHLAMLRALEVHSYIGVPLVAEGAVIGVLTLVMAESRRRYGARDLELAVALADRAALAVNHARLFHAASTSREVAERASRAKDEFLAMLGHELRNPLAPIVTALQLMKLKSPDKDTRERAIIERQVKHVVALVDDLLDVSRITRGKIELGRVTVELHDTLARALELSGSLLEERRHQLVADVAPGLRVLGDPFRLAQVLTNLIANAAKYTEPGGRIEVSAARTGDRITLRVRDNGSGIEPALLPHVFDLFVQGGQALDRARGGLGLGLAIVKSVVELHGGQVFADSAGPGQGSEFRVVLPAAATPAHVPTPTPVATPAVRAVRILVVDDNEDALQLLTDMLTLTGYQAVAAKDPVQALARAAQIRPEVALLDIGLPVMDGYELAQRLRQLDGNQAMKLVALTGYGQPSDKQRARAAGFDEHLVKPIAFEQLQAVLERLTGDAET